MCTVLEEVLSSILIITMTWPSINVVVLQTMITSQNPTFGRNFTNVELFICTHGSEMTKFFEEQITQTRCDIVHVTFVEN